MCRGTAACCHRSRCACPSDTRPCETMTTSHFDCASRISESSGEGISPRFGEGPWAAQACVREAVLRLWAAAEGVAGGSVAPCSALLMTSSWSEEHGGSFGHTGCSKLCFVDHCISWMEGRGENINQGLK